MYESLIEEVAERNKHYKEKSPNLQEKLHTKTLKSESGSDTVRHYPLYRLKIARRPKVKGYFSAAAFKKAVKALAPADLFVLPFAFERIALLEEFACRGSSPLFHTNHREYLQWKDIQQLPQQALKVETSAQDP
ncbi:hypothetical protein NECAME_02545 [Necator americanus]|uniref:Uncharacterized protein n=1 Tax=Necator americanus TaxID=51031 RepID=W2TFC2_NECAM|nr:hypothetical protein NECAME_02545 [Necator americanus]ETN79722.1 hypothetical protein NECAME_02545 [Necator americanus]